MKISERSTASPQSDENQLSTDLPSSAAAKKNLSLSAIVTSGFGKFDIGLRARLLGRLLASVGPLALKVVGGGVFAKYVRHARAHEIPVSFDDAAHATSSQVCDLVHYVEQSDPNLVEELSTALSRDDEATASTGKSISHCDQRPLEAQTLGGGIVGQQILTRHEQRSSQSASHAEFDDRSPAPPFPRRDLHDY